MKIYVGNLAHSASEDELKELFAGYGDVVSVNIIKDKFTGDPRGFGFVEMASKEEGQKAIEELNGKEFQGRSLNVNEARPRENRPRGGGFGGNRGGNGGGYNRGGNGGGYGRR